MDNTFLENFGGLNDNSLCHILSSYIDDENGEDNQPNYITHSPYYEDKFSAFTNQKNKFTILSSNIESLNAKFGELEAFIYVLRQVNVEFSVICLQECWLPENPDSSLIQLDGYNCYIQGQSCGRKGGLVTYVNKKYKCTPIPINVDVEYHEFQFLRIAGSDLKTQIIIGNFYRPPRNNTDCTVGFIDELNLALSKLDKLSKRHEVAIVGDFNIDLLKFNSNNFTNEFLESMLSHSYHPKITLPTRLDQRYNSASLIDNIFLKLGEVSLTATSGILTSKFSDHQPYFTCLDLTKKHTKPPKYVKITKNSPDDIKGFCDELGNINFEEKLDTCPEADPNENYNIFTELVNAAKEKHMPCMLVRYRKYLHKNSKWITFGIIKSIEYRDNLHIKMNNTRSETERAILKRNLSTYNGILKKTIREAKSYYYNNCFNNLKHDIKKTWTKIDEILNRRKSYSTFPEHFNVNGKLITDKKEIANNFNKFFTTIGPELADKIGTTTSTFTDYLDEKNEAKLILNPVSDKDVAKVIDGLQTKTSFGYDSISSKLIKIMKPVVISALTIIINQSLKRGIFPDKLKIARVIPLYKKDDDKLFTNYRPISLLPTFSKIFEKIIANQFKDYFEQNQYFYKGQYGFRTNHSTELAAIDLIEKIISNMDNGRTPLCIFIDMSKAFDTLNHNILINKLKHYGINNIALNLISSYLTNRRQYVDFNGIESNYELLTTGVPQGSVLGPLLFLIYINDIVKASKFFDYTLFADDTSLSTTLKIQENNPEHVINRELGCISEWLKANKLSLNVGKTKYMVFHQRNKPIIYPKITLEDTEIECVESFNFLGITIDKQLTWKDHLNKIATKISRINGILNKLKHYLPEFIKVTIYNTLILPHLMYGVLLWGHKWKKIEIIQKKSIRIITLSKYNSHTEPLFKNLSLLRIEDIFTLSKLKFYYKYANNQLPSNILSFNFHMNQEHHEYDTRGKDKLKINRVHHAFAQYSLYYEIPKLVNSLSSPIYNKLYTHSFQGFKNYVKLSMLSSYKRNCDIVNCYVCNNLTD